MDFILHFANKQSDYEDRWSHLYQIEYYITHFFIFLLFILHITTNGALYYTFI